MDIRDLNYTNNTFTNEILCTGSWPSTTIQLIIYIFILVSSLVGNVLVVAIFFRDKTLRTTVNYFIVNMCVSDLIYPIINLPIWILITINRNKRLLFFVEIQQVLCKVFLMAFGVSHFVSLFSMTAVAADRFRAIIFPMKPALFSPKKCCAAITAMWLCSMTMFLYHTTVSTPGQNSCIGRKSPSELETKVGLIFFLASFVLTCIFAVAITIVYLKVAIILHRQKNGLHLASEVVKQRAQRNLKIITMLIIIVIVFYVVYVPYYVMIFLNYVLRVSIPCVYVWLSISISPIIYPVINPVVYFVFNKKYRQGLWKILSCLPIVGLLQEN